MKIRTQTRMNRNMPQPQDLEAVCVRNEVNKRMSHKSTNTGPVLCALHTPLHSSLFFSVCHIIIFYGLNYEFYAYTHFKKLVCMNDFEIFLYKI